MTTGDVSTSFLHAPVTTSPDEEDIYIVPPVEYYPGKDVLWRLHKALYGLRTSPKAWQEHFAQELQQMGLRRLLTDPNIYVDPVKQVYIIAYVDDIMCFGEKRHIETIISELQKRVLLKVTGHLVPGESLNFLGRTLHHNGDGVTFNGLEGYIRDLLQEHSGQMQGSNYHGFFYVQTTA
jgi:hypothetical protein